jgi:hypothetical protein
MRRLASVVVLALGIALATAGSAAACSCIAISPGTKLKQSDGAVTARLLDARPLGGVDPPSSSATPSEFVYRIGRVIKGRPRLRSGRRLVVRSLWSGSSCGLSQDLGRVQGLFLRRANGRWRAGACDEIRAAQMRRLRGKGAAASAGAASCT